MVPREHTILIVEEELEGARAWAERHAVPLEWRPDELELRVQLTQPKTEGLFYLRGIFDNYREIPPAWQFCDEDWKASATPVLYPHPETVIEGPPPVGSIFHTKPVICAPFNRLAYGRGAVHPDWSMADWHSLSQPNQVKASTIGDMLQTLWLHLSVTRRRMA